jgi:hypothetical protein
MEDDPIIAMPMDEQPPLSAEYMRYVRMRKKTHENTQWRDFMQGVYLRQGMYDKLDPSWRNTLGGKAADVPGIEPQFDNSANIDIPGIEPQFGDTMVNVPMPRPRPPLSQNFSEIVRMSHPDTVDSMHTVPVTEAVPVPLPEAEPLPVPQLGPPGVEPQPLPAPKTGPDGAPVADPYADLKASLEREGARLREQARQTPLLLFHDDGQPPGAVGGASLGLPIDLKFPVETQPTPAPAVLAAVASDNAATESIVQAMGALYPEAFEEPRQVVTGVTPAATYSTETVDVVDGKVAVAKVSEEAASAQKAAEVATFRMRRSVRRNAVRVPAGQEIGEETFQEYDNRISDVMKRIQDGEQRHPVDMFLPDAPKFIKLPWPENAPNAPMRSLEWNGSEFYTATRVDEKTGQVVPTTHGIGVRLMQGPAWATAINPLIPLFSTDIFAFVAKGIENTAGERIRAAAKSLAETFSLRADPQIAELIGQSVVRAGVPGAGMLSFSNTLAQLSSLPPDQKGAIDAMAKFYDVAGGYTGRFMYDFVMGAGATPTSAVYAGMETIRGLLRSSYEINQWIDQNIPQLTALGRVLGSVKTPETYRVMLDYYNKEYPPLPPLTDTYTEAVLRPIMTYMAAAAVGGWVLGPVTGALPASSAATPVIARALPAFVGSFITANPDTKNISASINPYMPELLQPITSLLASDGNSSDLANRTKTALEGMLMNEGMHWLGQGAKQLARWMVSVHKAPGELKNIHDLHGSSTTGMISTQRNISETWMHPSASPPKTAEEVLVPIQGAVHNSSRGFRREAVITEEGANKAVAGVKPKMTGALDEHPIGIVGDRVVLHGSNRLNDIYTVLREQEKIVARDVAKGVGAIENATFDGVELMTAREANKLVREGRTPAALNIMTSRVIVNNEQAASETARWVGTQYRVLHVENNLDGAKGPLRALTMQIDLGNGSSARMQILPSEIAKVIKQPKYDEAALTAAWTKQTPSWVKPSAPVVGFQSEAAKDELRRSMIATPGGPLSVAQAEADRVFQSAQDYKQLAGFARLTYGDGPGPARTSDIWINFNRMQTEDDVKQVIALIADKYAPVIKAEIGVHRDEAIKALATRTGMTTEQLLTKTGPLSDSEVLASRMLLDTAAKTIRDLAYKAAQPGSSVADQWNFRVMEGQFLAITKHVLKSRAESARSLRAWGIPVGSGDDYLETARKLMAQNSRLPYGGDNVGQVNRKMAEYTYTLLATNEGAYPEFVKRTAGTYGALTLDMARESFQMSYLWGLRTHVRNMLGNTAMLATQIADNYTAAKIGNLLGTAYDDRIDPREAIAMLHATVTHIHTAAAHAGRSVVKGGGAANLMGGTSQMEWGGTHAPKISSQHVSATLGHTPQQAEEFANSAFGRFLDYALGPTIRGPGYALQLGDEFFKSLGFEAHLSAGLTREVYGKQGLKGAEALQKMAQLYADRPKEIVEEAIQKTLEGVFQNQPGNIGQTLMKLRDSGTLNPMVLVLPYLRTPINVLGQTIAHSPLAPFQGQWREAYHAGGASRDLALAKLANGIIGFTVAMNLAAGGMVTGPSPSNLAMRETYQRLGILPNALHVDGKYIDLFQIEPYGGLFSIAGGIADLMYTKEMDKEDLDSISEIMTSAIGLMTRGPLDKSFLMSLAQVAGALQDNERRTDAMVPVWRSIATGLLPMSSAMGMVNEMIDPNAPRKQVVDGAYEGVIEKIRGLRDKLPDAVDAWGDHVMPPQMFDGAIGSRVGVAVPIRMSEKKDNPVDRELVDHGSGLRSSSKTVNIDGVRIKFDHDSRNVFNDLRRMTGNGYNQDGHLIDREYALKHNLRAWVTVPAKSGAPEMGAKDFFNAMLRGETDSVMTREIYDEEYTNGREGTKVKYIKNTYAEFKQRALQVIMDPNYRKGNPEFEAFRDKVNAEKDRVRAITTPEKYHDMLVPNSQLRAQ